MNIAIKHLTKNISLRSLLISPVQANRTMSSTENYKFDTLKVTNPNNFVYHVELNRPDKLNAMNKVFWREIRECFTALNEEQECRVVILAAAGKVFTSGLDFQDMAELGSTTLSGDIDIARKARVLRKLVTDYQNSFTAIEKCNKPVIAAIHGPCIGGGIDMITACDIRYCTQDAWFQIKETDIGMAADVGTIQRLPKIVGNDSLARELTFTARKFYANEALQFGLVNRVLSSKEELLLCANETALMIASKSPVAVQGSKIHLNYSRDHTVQDGLDYMATWNMSHLLSEDLMKAAMATASKAKEPPVFAKY